MSHFDDKKENNSSDWSFVQSNQVQHANGFILELLSGSWECPMDIKPMINNSRLSGAEISGLIRNGLAFASTASPPEAAPAPVRPKLMPNPNANRPILSLKKTKKEISDPA